MTAKRMIALHEPVFAGNEWEYVKECLDTGWVSTAGKFVERFEQAAAERAGVKHAVAVVNGTCGLHLALRVLGVKAGDEVLVPSLTFIATAHAVVYLGAIPRFLDVEEPTCGLDPDAVEEYLKSAKKKPAACVPMHALGHPARVDKLVDVCNRHGVPVLEDAAEALGSVYQGRPAGAFGKMGVLSFNGNKIVTAGGGGMLVTNDKALADAARHLSTQAKSDAANFWHDDVGYNYRLPNVNAALGLAQLEQLDGFLKQKRDVANWYRAKLGDALIWEPKGARSNFWLNTVRLKTPELARAALKRLNDEGFGARPLWAPCHLQPALKAYPQGAMSVTERLWKTSVSLPSSASLTRAEVDEAAGLVLK